jgi:hypothetical protein
MPNVPTKELFDIEVSEMPIEEVIETQGLPDEIKRKYLNDARYLRDFGLVPGEYPGIPSMETTAYPNYDYSIHRNPPANTTKWLEAAQRIYYLTHSGEERGKALEKVIGNWTRMEQQDFYYWLRFYEEGGHLKYKAGEMSMTTKTAQLQFFDGVKQPGYYMPMHQQQPKPPTIDQVKVPETHPDVQEDERREQIETQRNKVLSRLDSVERLLRSNEGHIFAGNELETLLNSIYQLKNKFHTVNKRSLSTRLYEDLIVREANVLTRSGFFKGADLLHNVAQAIPNQPEANNPLQGGGIPGDLPGLGPGMTPNQSISNNNSEPAFDPAANAENPAQVGSPTAIPTDPAAAGMTQSSPTNNQTPGQNSPSAGMAEFLKGLEDGSNAFEDEDEEDEEYDHVSSASLALGLKLQAALVLEHFALGFVREAQVVPESVPATEPTEVQEPTPANDPEAKAGKDFDQVIDSAFQQLTVADVVSKLEDLTKVFKVREIPRQLAIVDMMLDRLGLASFFPSLGECVQKSHESNNYVSTRLEDILSRLRGTLETRNLDLEGDNAPPASGEAQMLQGKLQREQDAEQQRKKMRKDLSNRELENAGKPKPDLEVAEDLGAAPPQVAPPPAPAPAAPAV